MAFGKYTSAYLQYSIVKKQVIGKYPTCQGIKHKQLFNYNLLSFATLFNMLLKINAYDKDEGCFVIMGGILCCFLCHPLQACIQRYCP